MRQGWGFDFEWDVNVTEGVGDELNDVQAKMEQCIDGYMNATMEEERDGGVFSSTQMKKKAWDDKIAKRMQRSKARLASRRGGL
jgi:mitochondrial GTPase 1